MSYEEREIGKGSIVRTTLEGETAKFWKVSPEARFVVVGGSFFNGEGYLHLREIGPETTRMLPDVFFVRTI